jgi:hypothetical protein
MHKRHPLSVCVGGKIPDMQHIGGKCSLVDVGVARELRRQHMLPNVTVVCYKAAFLARRTEMNSGFIDFQCATLGFPSIPYL